MAFNTPALDETHAFGLDLARRLMPDMDVSEGSDIWGIVGTVAGMVTDNNVHIDATENDVMPDTATGPSADRWGGAKGVLRKSATPARGANVLRFSGKAGTSIPDNTLLVHRPSGLQYRTVGLTAIGSLGTVDVSVAAIDVGSKTRIGPPEALTLQQSIADVQDVAELQLPLDQGGDDDERDEDYVPRYLEFWSNEPLGGTASDFEKLAKAQPGVADAFCYPNRIGAGTTDIAALHAGSGAFRLLTEAETATLQATMNAKRPVGMRQFRVLQTVTVGQVVSVEVTIIDDGSLASAPDWDDRVPPTCAAWDAATRTLRFNALPPSLQPNDRLTISNGSTGRERVVESLSGTDGVVLMFDPIGDDPAVNSVIYAGGPLIEPARRALQALFDSLGTANPDAIRYGAWEGNLRLGAISRAVSAVRGVLDLGAIISPSSTVTALDPAANPLDRTIGLLIAGRLLVRYAH